MSDTEIDDVLKRLASPSQPVDPAVLGRITDSVQAAVTPAKPLRSTWALAGLLITACASVAIAAAVWAGPDGIAVLRPWQRTADLVSLGVLLVALAHECVVRSIPGGRPWLGATVAVSVCWAAILLLFALVFRDYRAEHFVSAGLGCLEQGVLHAIPAAILGAVVLRRGFATRPVLAALIAGALVGLSGVAFLEIHCGNIEAPHRLVWHAAVLPLCAALGALIAWILQRWRP